MPEQPCRPRATYILRSTTLEVRVLDHTIRGLARSCGERPLGTVVAVVGSSGRLEFAQVGGDCAARLGIGAGDRIQVRRLQGGTPAGELEPPRHQPGTLPGRVEAPASAETGASLAAASG